MRRRNRRLAVALSAWVLVTVTLMLAIASPAFADEPFPGVTFTYISGTNRVYVLEVDLCAPGVSVRATGPNDFPEHAFPYPSTTSEFAARVGAHAAVNGSFYDTTAYMPYGLSIGNGEPWPGTNDNSSGRGFIAFGADRVQLQPPAEDVGPPQPWMKESVGTGSQLVRDGVVPGTFAPSHCSDIEPRTGVGLSRDRRTLYLVTVDGNFSDSPGLTCRGFGLLLRDLGAWDALNLCGGGRTTMYIAGRGVVNRPNYGYEFAAPNHLGVYATGAGMPGSCVDARNALDFTGDLLDWGGTSDVDGDGLPDVCARAADGVKCYRSTGTSLSEELIEGPLLTDASGWTDPSNWATLRMGDINGDNRADLCARSDTGIQCWLSTGAGFEEAIDGPALADASGWAEAACYGTLRLADFNGDGLDDLCGRNAEGFGCWPSTGAGFGERVAGPALSDAMGFGGLSYAGTIRMGDVDGDGRADVCARGVDGMECHLSDGAGFPTAVIGPDWSDANGWGWPHYWATIRLADLDGDGRADLCGRSATDFRCYLSEGTAFGREIIGPPLSDADGWNAPARYGTIRMADIDGDRHLDVCARGSEGVFCWRFDGTGFSDTPVTGPAMTDADGWDAERFFRTLRVADVNGDGLVDMCGRASERMYCWLSDGDSVAQPIDGPEWSDAVGWGDRMRFGTIRLAGQRCWPRPEVCNGEDDDCDGLTDENCPLDGGTADGGDAGMSDGGDSVVGASRGCGCQAGDASGGGFGVFTWLFALWLVFRKRRPRS